jgi:hypothetical protein
LELLGSEKEWREDQFTACLRENCREQAGRLLLKKVGSLKFPSEKRESHKNHEELLHKALKVRIKFWKFIRQRMRSDQRIQNKIRWSFFNPLAIF